MKGIYKNVLKAIEQMKVVNQRLKFCIGIDGTKVPPSLIMNNAHKCMTGGTYPNHVINAINLGKECVHKIIESKEKPIALNQELKVAIMCMKNERKGAIPMAVIAARP